MASTSDWLEKRLMADKEFRLFQSTLLEGKMSPINSFLIG